MTDRFLWIFWTNDSKGLPFTDTDLPGRACLIISNSWIALSLILKSKLSRIKLSWRCSGIGCRPGRSNIERRFAFLVSSLFEGFGTVDSLRRTLVFGLGSESEFILTLWSSLGSESEFILTLWLPALVSAREFVRDLRSPPSGFAREFVRALRSSPLGFAREFVLVLSQPRFSVIVVKLFGRLGNCSRDWSRIVCTREIWRSSAVSKRADTAINCSDRVWIYKKNEQAVFCVVRNREICSSHVKMSLKIYFHFLLVLKIAEKVPVYRLNSICPQHMTKKV